MVYDRDHDQYGSIQERPWIEFICTDPGGWAGEEKNMRYQLGDKILLLERPMNLIAEGESQSDSASAPLLWW